MSTWKVDDFNQFVNEGMLIDISLTESYNQLWHELKSMGPQSFASRYFTKDLEFDLAMVRGLFGNWMPGHFSVPLKIFRSLNIKTDVVYTGSRSSMDTNSQHIADFLKQRSSTKPIVFLCHSKGGVEFLRMLIKHPNLGKQVAGLVGVQMPRGPSLYLESLLTDRHLPTRLGLPSRIKHWSEAQLIRGVSARASCLELCRPVINEKIQWIDQNFPKLRSFINVASFSTRASHWLEANHPRLNEISNSKPNDGVFLFEDQIWPQAKNIGLLEIDHAQPSVGGLGFQHEYLWMVLLALTLKAVDGHEH